jgi:hypothetical protein
MTVHVDELTTEVTPAPESAAPATAELEPQLEQELIRATTERLARDRARTCAEGFDD